MFSLSTLCQMRKLLNKKKIEAKNLGNCFIVINKTIVRLDQSRLNAYAIS